MEGRDVNDVMNERNQNLNDGGGGGGVDSGGPDMKPPSEENSPMAGKAGRFAQLGIGASLLFGKTKYLIGALKIAKAGPLVSMLLTSATYSIFFGWPYALGMVGQIFIHETGHAAVMHHYGIPFSPAVYIPFMGASIMMEKTPTSAYQNAIIAFGGPVVGGLGAFGLSALGHTLDSQLCFALADFGFMINLFNCMPIGQLDGGQISNAISPYIGVVGLGGGIGLAYYGVIVNPIFYLVLLSGAFSTGSRFFNWGDEEQQQKDREYYKIDFIDQAKLSAAMVALIGALLYGMKKNKEYTKPPPKEFEPVNLDDYLGKGWDDEDAVEPQFEDDNTAFGRG